MAGSGPIGQTSDPALLLAPGLLCLIVLFFLPVGLLVGESFVAVGEDGGRAFSLTHYARFFADDYYLGVMWRTFRLSFIVTLVTVVLGYPIAYLMARGAGWVALWLGILVIMPLMVSVVIRTFGWMVLMGRGGFLVDVADWLGFEGRRFQLMRTEAGIVIALGQVLLPFMTLTLYGVLAGIDRRLEEASRTMGAGFFGTLRRVTVPLSLPGIVSGSLLVFALSISSFITPALVGGVRLPMLASSVYQQALTTMDWPFAAAQAMILLVAVLVVIVPYTVLARTRHS